MIAESIKATLESIGNKDSYSLSEILFIATPINRNITKTTSILPWAESGFIDSLGVLNGILIDATGKMLIAINTCAPWQFSVAIIRVQDDVSTDALFETVLNTLNQVAYVDVTANSILMGRMVAANLELSRDLVATFPVQPSTTEHPTMPYRWINLCSILNACIFPICGRRLQVAQSNDGADSLPQGTSAIYQEDTFFAKGN